MRRVADAEIGGEKSRHKKSRWGEYQESKKRRSEYAQTGFNYLTPA